MRELRCVYNEDTLTLWLAPGSKRTALPSDFEDGWVHLRKSNTEPILRIYAEAASEKEANDLAGRFKKKLM